MNPKEFLSNCLEDEIDQGVLRFDREAYTNEELFNLEMETIFEGNWVYACHESQLSNPGDFLTLHLGRQPVVVLRNNEGELKAYLNTCSHRGAMIVREAKGCKKTFSCPFHGWTFDLAGKLVDVPYEERGGYPAQFDKADYSLKQIPKLDSYRGFVFASFNAEVGSLESWLGDTRTFIDMIVDQAPEGLEVLAGSSTYTFKANWKVGYENQADGYHAIATHGNYIRTVQNREKLQQAGQDGSIRAMDLSALAEDGTDGGFYDLDNGHVVLWWDWPAPQNRPSYPGYDGYIKKFGQNTADWMMQRARNVVLYPNVLFTDHMSMQIRVYRPVSVDYTEATIYCLGAKNEPAEVRNHRLRQYEDFFNASGMATSDDAAEFEAQQQGFAGSRFSRWNDLTRGITHLTVGADQKAQDLGIEPLYSGSSMEDEQIMWAQCRHWRDTMLAYCDKAS